MRSTTTTHILVFWRHYSNNPHGFRCLNLWHEIQLPTFFIHCPRLWLTQMGTSLSQALGPHGSRGFLRKGEIACTLTGNWQNVLSEKWKEDCRNSWRVLAVNLEGGNTLLTLAGFLATRTWGVPFSLKQYLPWGLTVPGARDSPLQGRTRH